MRSPSRRSSKTSSCRSICPPNNNTSDKFNRTSSFWALNSNSNMVLAPYDIVFGVWQGVWSKDIRIVIHVGGGILVRYFYISNRLDMVLCGNLMSSEGVTIRSSTDGSSLTPSTPTNSPMPRTITQIDLNTNNKNKRIGDNNKSKNNVDEAVEEEYEAHSCPVTGLSISEVSCVNCDHVIPCGGWWKLRTGITPMVQHSGVIRNKSRVGGSRFSCAPSAQLSRLCASTSRRISSIHHFIVGGSHYLWCLLEADNSQYFVLRLITKISSLPSQQKQNKPNQRFEMVGRGRLLKQPIEDKSMANVSGTSSNDNSSTSPVYCRGCGGCLTDKGTSSFMRPFHSTNIVVFKGSKDRKIAIDTEEDTISREISIDSGAFSSMTQSTNDMRKHICNTNIADYALCYHKDSGEYIVVSLEEVIRKAEEDQRMTLARSKLPTSTSTGDQEPKDNKIDPSAPITCFHCSENNILGSAVNNATPPRGMHISHTIESPLIIIQCRSWQSGWDDVIWDGNPYGKGSDGAPVIKFYCYNSEKGSNAYQTVCLYDSCIDDVTNGECVGANCDVGEIGKEDRHKMKGVLEALSASPHSHILPVADQGKHGNKYFANYDNIQQQQNNDDHLHEHDNWKVEIEMNEKNENSNEKCQIQTGQLSFRDSLVELLPRSNKCMFITIPLNAHVGCLLYNHTSNPNNATNISGITTAHSTGIFPKLTHSAEDTLVDSQPHLPGGLEEATATLQKRIFDNNDQWTNCVFMWNSDAFPVYYNKNMQRLRRSTRYSIPPIAPAAQVVKQCTFHHFLLTYSSHTGSVSISRIFQSTAFIQKLSLAEIEEDDSYEENQMMEPNIPQELLTGSTSQRKRIGKIKSNFDLQKHRKSTSSQQLSQQKTLSKSSLSVPFSGSFSSRKSSKTKTVLSPHPPNQSNSMHSPNNGELSLIDSERKHMRTSLWNKGEVHSSFETETMSMASSKTSRVSHLPNPPRIDAMNSSSDVKLHESINPKICSPISNRRFSNRRVSILNNSEMEMRSEYGDYNSNYSFSTNITNSPKTPEKSMNFDIKRVNSTSCENNLNKRFLSNNNNNNGEGCMFDKSDTQYDMGYGAVGEANGTSDDINQQNDHRSISGEAITTTTNNNNNISITQEECEFDSFGINSMKQNLVNRLKNENGFGDDSISNGYNNNNNTPTCNNNNSNNEFSEHRRSKWGTDALNNYRFGSKFHARKKDFPSTNKNETNDDISSSVNNIQKIDNNQSICDNNKSPKFYNFSGSSEKLYNSNSDSDDENEDPQSPSLQAIKLKQRRNRRIKPEIYRFDTSNDEGYISAIIKRRKETERRIAKYERNEAIRRQRREKTRENIQKWSTSVVLGARASSESSSSLFSRRIKHLTRSSNPATSNEDEKTSRCGKSFNRDGHIRIKKYRRQRIKGHDEHLSDERSSNEEQKLNDELSVGRGNFRKKKHLRGRDGLMRSDDMRQSYEELLESHISHFPDIPGVSLIEDLSILIKYIQVTQLEGGVDNEAGKLALEKLPIIEKEVMSTRDTHISPEEPWYYQWGEYAPERDKATWRGAGAKECSVDLRYLIGEGGQGFRRLMDSSSSGGTVSALPPYKSPYMRFLKRRERRRVKRLLLPTCFSGKAAERLFSVRETRMEFQEKELAKLDKENPRNCDGKSPDDVKKNIKSLSLLDVENRKNRAQLMMKETYDKQLIQKSCVNGKPSPRRMNPEELDDFIDRMHTREVKIRKEAREKLILKESESYKVTVPAHSR